MSYRTPGTTRPTAGPNADGTSETRAERHRAAHTAKIRRRLFAVGAATAGVAVVAGIAVAQAATLPEAASAEVAAPSSSTPTDASLDRTAHATRDLQRAPLVTGTPVAKKSAAKTSTDLPTGSVRVVAPSWHVRIAATANSSTASSSTVGAVLTQVGVHPDSNDQIVLTPPSAAQKKIGYTANVTVHRVDVKNKSTRTADKHGTVVKKDKNRYTTSGTKVQRAGKNGTKTVVQRVTTVDGKVTAKKTIKTSTTAVDTVLIKGTKKAPAKKAASAKAPAAVKVAPGGAKAIAQKMAAARGWGSGQFQCLVNLWNRESGWNASAMNASSGAYGIPQSLPGSKMASAGADWRTNAATQIKWGLGYIAGSYGTPCGAWAHSQATGWY